MTTKLTDSQKQTIRIALAKWMGWNPINCEDDKCWIASLDACHEIAMEVKKRSSFFYRKYLRTLRLEVRENAEDANSEYRSLALFLALNLGELGD